MSHFRAASLASTREAATDRRQQLARPAGRVAQAIPRGFLLTQIRAIICFNMKRVHFYGASILIGMGLPILVFAQFKGPTTQPPGGNVPGVIWNMLGGGTQSGATININGSATVNDITTAPSVTNHIFGNNFLEPGKAFHVNQLGAATYYMGNWGGSGSSVQPLTYTVNGDLYAERVGPFYTGAGNEGRMQARKFCFYPGTNPSDCLSSWSSLNSLYVQKVGDSMTGKLSISLGALSGVALETYSGSGTGVSSTAVFAVQGKGMGAGSVGGTFSGGTGVIGNATGNGGIFTGGGYGITSDGASGSVFTNNSTDIVYLSSPGYGVYTSVPSTDYALYTNGKNRLGGVTSIVGNLTVSGNEWGDGTGSSYGNKTDPSGATHYPYTVAPINNGQCYYRSTSQASGSWIYCPAGTYMAGMQANMVANTYNIMCCLQ